MYAFVQYLEHRGTIGWMRCAAQPWCECCIVAWSAWCDASHSDTTTHACSDETNRKELVCGRGLL